MSQFFQKHSTWVWAVALLFIVDGVSKFLTHQYLPVMSAAHPHYPYGGIGVFENFLGVEFSISHTINKGAVWGIFGSYQWPLLALRICLVSGMIAYLAWSNDSDANVGPLLLIISGAAGNILDTFLYGHVVDMLHFVLWGWDYPVFNVADSCIVIGVVILCILGLKKDESKT